MWLAKQFTEEVVVKQAAPYIIPIIYEKEKNHTGFQQQPKTERKD